MDPIGFWELAYELARGSRPAETRSAISRAYYATYHTGRDVLIALGFTPSSGPAAHTHVQDLLGAGGNADHELKRAVSQMRDLYRKRLCADYKLDDLDVERAGTARTWVGNARRVMQILEACLSEPRRSRIRDAIAGWNEKVRPRG